MAQNGTTARKYPDYSESAVNLVNPPEIKCKLLELARTREHLAACQADITATLETHCAKTVQDKAALEVQEAALLAEIRAGIETLGSYQDTVLGHYAVRQARQRIIYQVELTKKSLPANLWPAVIMETVNTKALEGLAKGGLVAPDQLDKCGVKETTYATIVSV